MSEPESKQAPDSNNALRSIAWEGSRFGTKVTRLTHIHSGTVNGYKGANNMADKEDMAGAAKSFREIVSGGYLPPFEWRTPKVLLDVYMKNGRIPLQIHDFPTEFSMEYNVAECIRYCLGTHHKGFYLIEMKDGGIVPTEAMERSALFESGACLLPGSLTSTGF